MKIKESIINRLNQSIGNFSYRLIYVNNEQKNYVYLIKSKKDKFILKVSRKFNKNNFKNDTLGRKRLEKLLKNAGIKNVKVTKLINSDKEQGWILTKFEKFNTLYDIYNKNKKKFEGIISNIYSDFFPKLLIKYKIRQKIPGEFSLQDIGHYRGKIYFYDLEASKELIKQYIDLYSKLCKYYFRAIKKKRKKDEIILKKLIDKIKIISKTLNKRGLLNRTLVKRLHSKVFSEFENKDYNKLIEEVKF